MATYSSVPTNSTLILYLNLDRLDEFDGFLLMDHVYYCHTPLCRVKIFTPGVRRRPPHNDQPSPNPHNPRIFRSRPDTRV